MINTTKELLIENKIVVGVFPNYQKAEFITIPDDVIVIGGNAFKNCKYLTSVILPESVVKLYFGAFSGCSNLKEINIPDSVNFIGDFCFLNCDNLTIKCNHKSFAEKYAYSNDIRIEYLDSDTYVNDEADNAGNEIINTDDTVIDEMPAFENDISTAQNDEINSESIVCDEPEADVSAGVVSDIDTISAEPEEYNDKIIYDYDEKFVNEVNLSMKCIGTRISKKGVPYLCCEFRGSTDFYGINQYIRCNVFPYDNCVGIDFDYDYSNKLLKVTGKLILHPPFCLPNGEWKNTMTLNATMIKVCRNIKLSRF